jgi:hypothetical protein
MTQETKYMVTLKLNDDETVSFEATFNGTFEMAKFAMIKFTAELNHQLESASKCPMSKPKQHPKEVDFVTDLALDYAVNAALSFGKVKHWSFQEQKDAAINLALSKLGLKRRVTK